MPIPVEDIWLVSAGGSKVCALFYFNFLSTGELLTGTPTVSVVSGSTSNVTISSVGRNSATVRHKGGKIAQIDQVVQCLVTATTGAAGTYTLRVKCGTDASPATNEPYDVTLKVQ